MIRNLLRSRPRGSDPRDWDPRGLGAGPHDAGRGAGSVSVIVPLYNHARFVAQAVQSALAQGPILREVVVVDDGSPDESAKVMRGLCEGEPRIVFWSQPNRGAHAAINAGLQRATGDLLAILNSDDVYEPDRLATLAAALDGEEPADIAASGISFVDGGGAPIENAWYEEALQFFKSRGDLGAALVNGNFLMTTSNFLIRRRLLDEIGLFAPLRYAHDLDFALRAAARGKRFALTDRRLLRYRVHDSNTIREDHGRVRLEWAIAAAFFLTSLWDRPHGPPIDWRRAEAIEDILDRHALTRAVHLCMAYLRRYPTDTLERSPVLHDEPFRGILAGCLR
jgi:glycosyltransferase involved in cell wall biosynthesis